ncbi:hypothetical protein [Candidatus Endomicrobiellum trichonymphae]
MKNGRKIVIIGQIDKNKVGQKSVGADITKKDFADWTSGGWKFSC